MDVASDAAARLAHDVFVTALEGGIGYWSQAISYRWSLDGGTTPDLEGFRAVVEDVVGGDDTMVTSPITIDRTVIDRGLRLAATDEVAAKYPGVYELQGTGFAYVVGNERFIEAVDFDADTADAVVQLGVFGEVIYG